MNNVNCVRLLNGLVNPQTRCLTCFAASTVRLLSAVRSGAAQPPVLGRTTADIVQRLSTVQEGLIRGRFATSNALKDDRQKPTLCDLNDPSSIHHEQPPPTSVNKDNSIKGNRPAYMDYQATTVMDPRVLDKMLPTFIDQIGNAHSRTHSYGWEAEDIMENARREVANLIGANPKEIIWTSGATECNNMAIKGAAEFYSTDDSKKRHIVTTQVEHKCVLASCRYLQHKGWDVTYIPVKQDGLVDLTEFEKAIRPGETLLASVIFVHNEIGVIQPIKEIAAICRKHKVFLHTDAAQAAGKIPINVEELNIDLMSMSGHKMYGPKGVGALYVRGRPRVRLATQMHGGGQERGFRSGTLAVPLIVGMGEAARLCGIEMEADKHHVQRLSRRLLDGVRSQVPDVMVNGSLTERYFGNLNLSFAFVEGESLLMSVPGLALSSGSACTSASLEPSYVLRALGVDEESAHTSIRFGIGRFTTEEEVDQAISDIVNNVQRLRDMSPLYEMSLTGDTSGAVWT